MKITLNIERLVLEGVSATPAQADRIRLATETELRRLLATGGMRSRGSGMVPDLPAAPLRMMPDRTPHTFGVQIARSVYRSLAPDSVPSASKDPQR
jgi:hypothetical protein